MSADRITGKDLSPPKILDQYDEVSSFSCGVKGIDEFIQKEALDFQKERLGVTYIFMHAKELVGFATLSMADLKREKMEAKDRLNSKIENYPALLIGQLAVFARNFKIKMLVHLFVIFALTEHCGFQR